MRYIIIAQSIPTLDTLLDNQGCVCYLILQIQHLTKKNRWLLTSEETQCKCYIDENRGWLELAIMLVAFPSLRQIHADFLLLVPHRSIYFHPSLENKLQTSSVLGLK